MSTPTPAIRIDIVSDVVCPWCIIGFKQLERGIAAAGTAAQVHWHPFELNPHMPPEGQDLREHVREKYGSTPEQSRVARERLVQLGESLGFPFRYAEGARIYNTFMAHQLLHWAGEQGKQTELKLALFDAYFTRQENVADVGVLVAAADRACLDAGEAAAVLHDQRHGDAVRQAERFWLERGIHAVPAFVVDQGYLISGAQHADVFNRVLRRVSTERAA